MALFRSVENYLTFMADSWLTQLVIAALNIFLGMLFVLANTDFCGSVFETQVGKLTLGQLKSAQYIHSFYFS